MLLVFYLGAGCQHCVEQLNLLATDGKDFEALGISIIAISTGKPADLSKSTNKSVSENFERVERTREQRDSFPQPSPPAPKAFGVQEERERQGATTGRGSRVGKPALALITLVPLAWLLAVTMTAGVQKIFHSDPRIGFLAQAQILRDKQPGLEQVLAAAKSAGSAASIDVATREFHSNRVLRFNNLLDAFVTAGFLVLVAAIAMLSIREWILLLARRKLALLRESEPVWLPDYVIAETRPLHVLSLVALTFALAKELSGQAHFERAQETAKVCGHCQPDYGESAAEKGTPERKTDQQLYVEVTAKRFNGVTRCC